MLGDGASSAVTLYRDPLADVHSTYASKFGVVGEVSERVLPGEYLVEARQGSLTSRSTLLVSPREPFDSVNPLFVAVARGLAWVAFWGKPDDVIDIGIFAMSENPGSVKLVRALPNAVLDHRGFALVGVDLSGLPTGGYCVLTPTSDSCVRSQVWTT